MNAKKIFLYIILTVVIAYLVMYFGFYDQLIEIINYINLNEEMIEDNIGWFATILSVVLYAKSRIVDTRLLHKLEKEYGKKKLVDSLTVLLNLLKIYEPEYVIQKISLISEIEVDMRKAIAEIDNMLTKKDPLPDLVLSKKEQRILKARISNLLLLIDKQIDIGNLEKGIKGVTRAHKLAKPLFDDIQNHGKESLIDNFTK